MITEDEIKLANRLYSSRDACARLFGKDYKGMIRGYETLILAYMKKHNEPNEIKAAMALIKEAEGTFGADVFAMKTLAACVELIEPTKKTGPLTGRL